MKEYNTPFLRPNVEKVLQQMKENQSENEIPKLRNIKGIKFGILSPQEIMDMSVCKVTKSKISSPLEDTVYDERMGPSHSDGICKSCGQDYLICPGHFGHIDLAVPIIHPQFIKLIISILNCICISCSKLKTENRVIDMVLGEESERILSYRDRLKSVEKFCMKIPFCKHCQEPCPEIIYDIGKIYGIYSIGNDKKKDMKMQIDTDELITILKKITNDDLNKMGLNIQMRKMSKHNGIIQEEIPSFRPEWLIITRLPVLPSLSRPPNYENMQKSDDDLTSSYTEIIKCNQKLLENDSKMSEKNRIDNINALQNFITCFIDNKDEKHKHTSGKAIKSIKERIGGKQGHIRSKLMGKRVDCSARSVITADSTLELDELGVPERIAKSQSFPEIVTPKNIKRLTELLEQNKINMVRRGKIEYMHEYTKKNAKPLRLKYGDYAFRQLQDGDVIVFNRQPTLHRGGMMTHRVRILPCDTFRLNISVTSPYNADFDGDEMQAHILQDYATVFETSELMNVRKMIVSSQSNKPIIGVIQDGLIGAYLLTQKSKILSKKQFMNCIMSSGTRSIQNFPDLFKRAFQYYSKDELYSGRVLFSSLLPRDFQYTCTNNADSHEPTVIIQNGILTKGVIDKKIIGRTHGSIIHRLYKDYSPDRAADFLSMYQFMINRFLIYNGFSVGISDFIINPENKNGVKESIHKAFIEVESIQQMNDPEDLQEFKINNALNNRGQNLAVNGLCPNNRLEVMIKSGSKGNKMNIIQIAGHLGQTNVDGKRIAKELDDSNRTLFCFRRGDEHPKTRGFIEHSFFEGLTTEEFFFHCKAGREGVINTACKTKDSGYIERKLVKRMEDLIVENDLTVRNCLGNIVQFSYGNDNFDATWMLSSPKDKPSFIDVQHLADRLNSTIPEYPNSSEYKTYL